jgi:hypothetical protein
MLHLRKYEQKQIPEKETQQKPQRILGHEQVQVEIILVIQMKIIIGENSLEKQIRKQYFCCDFADVPFFVKTFGQKAGNDN